MGVVRHNSNGRLEYRLQGAHCEIIDIHVESVERRKYIGRKMVTDMLAELPAGTRFVYAVTRESNRIAQQFYVGVGFRVVGVLSRFYQTEDGVMYGMDVAREQSV